MEYQSQSIKILHGQKNNTGDKFLLTINSGNILTAWKFLLSLCEFTGNGNRLIVLIAIEEKIQLLQIIN